MRILFLTILFLSPLYYFSKDGDPQPEVDSIALKASAPDRIERILTVERPVEAVSNSQPEVTSSPDNSEESDDSSESEGRNPSVDSIEDVEEVHMSDLEESWNNELKQLLNRFEPANGDEIHKSYLQEQESYRIMVDGLLSEKNQKTSDEASEEIEQMIQQLDYKHQERLKEILGPHFEAVRDAYDDYMETAPQEE